MSEEMTTLGESCQFFNGKAHEKDIDVEGKYVVVNSKFISRDGKVRKYTGKQMFPLFEDDIVMVMSDVPNGKALAKCHIIEENDKYSLNQRICAIRTTEFNIRFLYYQLNRNPFFLAFNNGENQSNLRKGDILNCPLWKPTIEIQDNIVELLDKTLEKIDEAQTNIEKNIVNANNLLDSFTTNILNEFSNEKNLIEFKELVKLSRGHNPPKKDFIYEKKENNVRFYQIRDGWSDNYKVYVPKTDKLHLVEKHEMLMVAYRHIGKVFRGVEGAFNVALCKITNKDNSVLNDDYLFELIPSRFIKGELLKISERSLIPSMSVKELEKMKVPVPSLENQILIVERISEIRDFVNDFLNFYTEKLDLIVELKRSVLEKAFTGELTKNAFVI